MSGAYHFLIDTYRTERLKTLGAWAQVPEARFDDRVEPRARTPHEHLVHQCLSEDAWMRNMFGIAVALPALPPTEARDAFIAHYAAVSAERLSMLESCDAAWFEEEIAFFDARRSRAWALTRRLTHSAHHRGQLLMLLRLWGCDLYSNYGPTADTGGLAANGATVIYKAATVDELLARSGEPGPALPGPGEKAPTERPGLT